MDLFLNIAGSVCMAAFLCLLVWRGLWQLGWLPKALACPFAAADDLQSQSTAKKPAINAQDAALLQSQSVAQASAEQTSAPAQSIAPCSKREGIAWFAAALVLTWFFVWVGFRYSGQQNFYSFLPYAWQRFTTAGDAPHYQYLAEDWYATAGDSINLIVFYPLYPLLVKGFSLLTLGNALVAGVVLSNLCWGLAAVAMRRLAGRFYGGVAARCATLSMLLFPFSFFAIGMFTESLFLLLTILTLDAIATKRFTKAGIFGCLAALCRTQGVLLILAAVYAFLQAYRGKQALKEWRKALPLALVPLGYLIYLGLNWCYCGDPLTFLY
ncbi:MAG: hypothetical protein R3Y06_10405, partial [Faecalibacterium sp.]